MAAVLRGQEGFADVMSMAPPELLGEWVTDRVVFFPIRHHSPACSRHLEVLLRHLRPRAVLVEGPASFTRWIPLILHPRTRAPFAVYTSFEVASDPDSHGAPKSLSARRQAAYYPFCDYSPELVALRVGSELGADLRFIDLEYPDQMRARDRGSDAMGPRIQSLTEERYLRRSRSLAILAARAGCRDHNELWDHLFEVRLPSDWGSVQAFIRDVAAWCAYGRLEASPDLLKADGTFAREERMAWVISRELSKCDGQVVVVTGGFHTVALPGLVQQTQAATGDQFEVDCSDGDTCLVRYGFEALDALNGYSAGMPSPYYYDRLWRAATRNPGAGVFNSLAAEILVELGQLTRSGRTGIGVSTADEVAALEQACRLASLRGHPGPMREDILDAVRSCFVKGAMEVEGELVLGLVGHLLGGTEVGEVPEEAGAPPLIEDFRRMARELKLDITTSAKRRTSLDLYRKSRHRQVSRFLHSLAFLEVPFAELEAGPDFQKGTGLERLFEHWTYQWGIRTEGSLVEAGVFGSTVEEAAGNRIVQAMALLDTEGHGRRADAAVALLVRCCQMGLHRHSRRLIELVSLHGCGDVSLPSLASALTQLQLLQDSREPLEAHGLPGLHSLIRGLFERVCFVLQHLASTPPEDSGAILEALLSLVELQSSAGWCLVELPPDLFWDPLAAAAGNASCTPHLAGGAVGLLMSNGRMTESEWIRHLDGTLKAATGDIGRSLGFLTGLLRASRELAWQQPVLVQRIEAMMEGWTEDEFLQRVPHLRLAFADLTPRETDQVAAVVSTLHGGHGLDLTHASKWSEAEVLLVLRADALMRKTLAEDALEDWGVPLPVAEVKGRSAS